LLQVTFFSYGKNRCLILENKNSNNASIHMSTFTKYEEYKFFKSVLVVHGLSCCWLLKIGSHISH